MGFTWRAAIRTPPLRLSDRTVVRWSGCEGSAQGKGRRCAVDFCVIDERAVVRCHNSFEHGGPCVDYFFPSLPQIPSACPIPLSPRPHRLLTYTPGLLPLTSTARYATPSPLQTLTSFLDLYAVCLLFLRHFTPQTMALWLPAPSPIKPAEGKPAALRSTPSSACR